MPREQSKCREWEKERRNRLNEAFTSLCKLLPCYDPAANTSKIDILRNAASYIEELQGKIKGLLTENNEEGAKNLKDEEFKKLHDQIKKLLNKNEQLCILLREAKITIPTGCSLKKIRNSFSWTNRILPEQAKILQKKEQEKENNALMKKRKFTNKNKSKLGGQNSAPKHRKAILNRSDPKKIKPSKKKKIKSLPTSKCVILLSQPSTQPCYIITNAPSNNNILGGTSTVITNSGLITNPLVSSKAAKTVPPIPPLGPGTLILANGSIMPVLPQQTVLPLASQIITRPPIILLPRNTVTLPSSTTSTESAKIVTTTSTNKGLTRIKPKYCFTKTTTVNKVPIPALTSRYSNPDVVLNKNEPKQKSKVVEKKAVAKEPEKKKGEAPGTGEKRKIVTPESGTELKKAKITTDEEKEKEPEKVPEAVSAPVETPPEEGQKGNKAVTEKPADKTPENDTLPKVTENEAKKPEESIELNINHSELSNDIFASLQVPAGCQNPESTSPTAAFLLAFPLVSSLTGVKVTEVTEEDNPESQRGTPTLLQIGTMDTTKPTQSESLTPSLLNLDNLSFFASKEMGGFYNSFDSTIATTTSASVSTTTSTVTKPVDKVEKKVEYNRPTQPQQQEKNNQLVPCFENHNPTPTFASNSTNQQLSYQPKASLGKTVDKQITCSNYQNQKGFSCSNFNDPPKVSTTCSYTNSIKSYPEPLYTNSSTYTYSNTTDTSFNQNYYKEIPKTDNRSYYSLNYENYTDYRKNDGTNTYFPTSNYYSNGHYTKDKFGTSSNTNAQKNKTGTTQSRPPINWMTTPDNRLQTPSEYVLPQFTTKETDFYSSNTFTNTQTTYFNTFNTNEVSTNHQEPRKNLDLPLVPPVNTYQRNEVEENQFSWSPTKIPQFLDPNHSFVSSTLPTLVGDLALGNPLTFGDQKDKCQNSKKDSTRRIKYENSQSNFLSVSQLVDHNKEVVPARTTTRRNSGNRSSAKKVPPKPNQRKEKELYPQKVESGKGTQMKQVGYSGSGSTELFCDSAKNRKNNYSAEALIGHQMQDAAQKNRQTNYGNKPISVSSFLHDNIIPYFPTVDLPQDNSYMQQNQNYQSTSFSHNFSNNSYTANSFIPTTTITSTYNFMHEVGTHDYSDNLNLFPPMTKDKTCSSTKNVNRNIREQQCPITPKKSKRKHSNESNLPGFVDFPFLSMPGSINSPILPDDFHTHTGFLQPPTPQLYPCKNPFTKPNDLGGGSLLPLPVPVTRNIQHPEISPSINNAGTSLTNFNLCTIFPEMNNKVSVLPDYSEPRIKEHPRSYSSAIQVTFNDKPTFSFSYINSTTSQTYNNQ